MEKVPLVPGGAGRSDSKDSLRRDLNLARNAYYQGNAELSRAAHSVKNGSVGVGVAGGGGGEEGHQSEGGFIKSVVFGGLDGILTTFAIVSGATGGGFATTVVLVLGFSSKIADGFAMGLGDALSTRAEHAHIQKEKEREYWEFDNYPEGEIQEMIELYENAMVEKDGANREEARKDAELVIRLMSDHRDFFVDVMMVEELGLMVPDDDENPWFDGFITFCSFVFFGFFPLLGYCIFPLAFPDLTSHQLFLISCITSGLTLFLLGAIKSLFSVKSWWASGLEMLVIGYTVCFISYTIGALTNQMVTGGVPP